ncbi:MAG: hypothetical protein RL291_1718, partial [Pseudomonadota bacterium]
EAATITVPVTRRAAETTAVAITVTGRAAETTAITIARRTTEAATITIAWRTAETATIAVTIPRRATEAAAITVTRRTAETTTVAITITRRATEAAAIAVTWRTTEPATVAISAVARRATETATITIARRTAEAATIAITITRGATETATIAIAITWRAAPTTAIAITVTWRTTEATTVATVTIARRTAPTTTIAIPVARGPAEPTTVAIVAAAPAATITAVTTIAVAVTRGPCIGLSTIAITFRRRLVSGIVLGVGVIVLEEARLGLAEAAAFVPSVEVAVARTELLFAALKSRLAAGALELRCVPVAVLGRFRPNHDRRLALGDRFADFGLDVLQERPLFEGAEENAAAVGTLARKQSEPLAVGACEVRHLEVNDKRNVFALEVLAHAVGHDNRGNFASTEQCDGLFFFIDGRIRVHGRHNDAVARKITRELFSRALRADVYNDALADGCRKER